VLQVRSKIFLLVLSGCLSAVLLQGTASAAPVETTAVETITEDEILWVSASVQDSTVDSLQIRILTPKSHGKRSVFQRCRFTFQGMGEYRCGIDVSSGSAASDVDGAWRTHLVVDGEVTDRASFSL
jgi:hypothetical protein